MSKDNERIENLILNGALEVAGMDLDTGEPLYTFTDKLASVDKQLYDASNNYFYKEITNLWEKGFLNINFFEDSPTVSLTEKAFNDLEVEKIEDDLKSSLKEIKRITGENYGN
jgi:hypothetical protein